MSGLMPERPYVLRQYSSAEYLQRRGFMIEDYVLPAPKHFLVRDIQEAVARHYNLPVDEMWSARRHREVARPRQVAMYLAWNMTARSLLDIGRRFGDRDHTTVRHAIQQIERLLASDYEIRAAVISIRRELEA